MVDALTEISLSKLPPYNKEAEQSVLGSCLHSSEAIAKALEVLSEEDFYKAANKKIFIVMREQFEANEPIDVLALADRLRKKDELDNVGGLELFPHYNKYFFVSCLIKIFFTEYFECLGNCFGGMQT
jgi:replicative DNA helicase